MSTNLTEAEFGRHLNTTYHVAHEGASLGDLELIEVQPHIPSQIEHSGMERFSAVFQGPEQPQLPQRIYSFTHDEMGEFELFIVPIARNERGFVYEAVFNYYK